MKIVSYNVNGIRAALKKGFLDWLQAASPDVICIQETKAHKEQLDLTEFENAGYPYHYWFSAQKKGYSSVAIFCKEKPNHIAYGTGIETMDFEGRNLRVDFDGISVMSLYLANCSQRPRSMEILDSSKTPTHLMSSFASLRTICNASAPGRAAAMHANT